MIYGSQGPQARGVRVAAIKNDVMLDSIAVSQSKSYRKWERMEDRGFEWFVAAHRSTFLRRLRRGVPQEFRWKAWRTLLCAKYTDQYYQTRLMENALKGNSQLPYHPSTRAKQLPGGDPEGIYFPFMSTIEHPRYLDLTMQDSPFNSLISIDVPRTFPEIGCFDETAQKKLFRVLNAFANYKPEVGYCQGMNFVVGFLLLISDFDEFETFEVLVGMMEFYCVEGLFRDRFPLLRRYVQAFDSIMERVNPELHAHFQKEGVLPPVYLHQWILTLFVRGLPLKASAVVWDYIFAKGLHGIVIVCVSLLKVLQRFLLHLNFEDAVKFLKSLKCSGQCDEGRIGRMLVRQAEGTEIPKELLDPIRQLDIQTVLKDMKDDEDDVPDRGDDLNGLDLLNTSGANEGVNPLSQYLAQNKDDDDDDDPPVASSLKIVQDANIARVVSAAPPDLLTEPYAAAASASLVEHRLSPRQPLLPPERRYFRPRPILVSPSSASLSTSYPMYPSHPDPLWRSVRPPEPVSSRDNTSSLPGGSPAVSR